MNRFVIAIMILLIISLTTSITVINGHTYVFVKKHLIGLMQNTTIINSGDTLEGSKANVEAFSYKNKIYLIVVDVNYTIPGYATLGLGNLSIYVFNMSGYLEEKYMTSMYVYSYPILIKYEDKYLYVLAPGKDNGAHLAKIDLLNKSILWSIDIKKIDGQSLTYSGVSVHFMAMDTASNDSDYLCILLATYPNGYFSPVPTIIVINKSNGEVVKALSIKLGDQNYWFQPYWYYNGVSIEYPYVYVMLGFLPKRSLYGYVLIAKIDIVNKEIIWAKKIKVASNVYVGPNFYDYGGWLLLHGDNLYVFVGDYGSSEDGYYVMRINKSNGSLERCLKLESNEYHLGPPAGTGLFYNDTHIMVSTIYNLLVFDYELDNATFITLSCYHHTGIIITWNGWIPVYTDNGEVHGFIDYYRINNQNIDNKLTLIYNVSSSTGWKVRLKIPGKTQLDCGWFTEYISISNLTEDDVDFGDISISLSDSTPTVEVLNEYMWEAEPPPTSYSPVYVENYTHIKVSQPNTSRIQMNVTVVEEGNVIVINGTEENEFNLLSLRYGYVLSTPLAVIYSPQPIIDYRIDDRDSRRLILRVADKTNISIATKPGYIEKIIVDDRQICSNSTQCELLRDEDNVIVVDPGGGSTVIIVFKYRAYGGRAVVLNPYWETYTLLLLSVLTCAFIYIILIGRRRDREL